MDLLGHPGLARVVARATGDSQVLALVFFGSRARGHACPDSDFDVCLVLRSERDSDLAGAEKRLEYLAEADVELAVFEQLPLHICSRVFKDGTVLFVRDEDALYASRAVRRGPSRPSATSTASTSIRSCVIDRDRLLAKLE